jgi:hypothetical protein
MLICVQKYSLEVKQKSESSKDIEVVLIIDDLKVISFDQYAIKLPSSVSYDDQVRNHLAYMRHHKVKKQILATEYELAEISHFPA